MKETSKAYAWKRLAGETGEETEYILTLEDDCDKEFCDYLSPIGVPDPDDGLALPDLPEIHIFNSLEEALEYLKERYKDKTPCPEHSRILLWEVLPSGHRKVVWHYSGWHYVYPFYTTLPQGTLPGDSKSLYYRSLDSLDYAEDLAGEFLFVEDWGADEAQR